MNPEELTFEQIKNAMDVLKSTQGWQLIVQFLQDGYLTPLKKRIEGKDKIDPIKDIADLQGTQYKLNMIEWLIAIPDELSTNDVDVLPESQGDPYAKSLDEVKKDLDNEFKAAKERFDNQSE